MFCLQLYSKEDNLSPNYFKEDSVGHGYPFLI